MTLIEHLKLWERYKLRPVVMRFVRDDVDIYRHGLARPTTTPHPGQHFDVCWQDPCSDGVPMYVPCVHDIDSERVHAIALADTPFLAFYEPLAVAAAEIWWEER